jgi:hypothetical protein
MTRYLLLIHSDEASWDEVPDDVKHARYAEYGRLAEDLRAAGHYVEADELAPADSASLVRVRDGEVLRTEGPFAETREQLGGYYLVECGLEEAIAYAARIPAANDGTIEVRAVAEG